MENKKLVIAAGHYYGTAGKRTPDGVREWTLNNAVCNFIAEYLQGYNVEITRVDDTTGKTAITLAERVKKTNKINPDLFIEIHHNAYNGKWNDVTGVEVYSHTQGSAEDKKVAKLLAPKIAKETGLKNRGAKTMALQVLTCKATIPAVLCEGGFMDSKIDNPVITSEKGQRAYAKAVADGVIEYLKLERVIEIEPIEKKSIILINDAELYDIVAGKSVKNYTKGTIIENIVAIASYKENKYYITEYSYTNKAYNGFKVTDCEEYKQPVTIENNKHWLIRLIEFILDLFK